MRIHDSQSWIGDTRKLNRKRQIPIQAELCSCDKILASDDRSINKLIIDRLPFFWSETIFFPSLCFLLYTYLTSNFRNMKLLVTITVVLAGSTTAFVSTSTTSRPTTTANVFPGTKGTGEGWIAPSSPVNSEASLRLTLEKSLEGASFQKRLSLLGSTGSIGTQTLEIVDACPDNFVVDALSAGTNAKLMSEQVLKYKPKIASMSTPQAAAELKERLIAANCQEMPEILHGDDGILAAATIASADTVVTGIVGAAGLKPTIEAIKLKKDIALANKETLISGGPVINPLVKEYGINMLPADSEHSAIFQCLQGVPEGGLRRVILTASGGAFRDLTKDELFKMCQEDPRAVQAKATTHPNWDMGAKITLDSATMMNKGLEVSPS